MSPTRRFVRHGVQLLLWKDFAPRMKVSFWYQPLRKIDRPVSPLLQTGRTGHVQAPTEMMSWSPEYLAECIGFEFRIIERISNNFKSLGKLWPL